ncbi:MAG: Txe/YoeB family addiction module toxin [Rhodocyclaceae bacterium]|nr:Txe/YoeB family addiction module toxin [Rhodocyclaceae bacterium]
MTLAVKFTEHSAEDFDFWQRTDARILERIKALLRDAREHPFTGIGKPEPLKHDLSGYWSRRINREHRLVYTVETDLLIVHQCRFHYAQQKK